ncbi:MAG: NUDIX domain-containing protein [Clostridia bacterium]|jgi:ADP-ribose pyrophosphatase YjhB (NUDIX family)|nr:NUDIX domain-containing protein [Clostridia bacterium]
MEILKEIEDKKIESKDFYAFKRAARAVIINDNNEIGLMYIGKYDYYKLPGGEVDFNEEIHDALGREIDEEVGKCDIEILDEIGVVVETREFDRTLSMSYAFLVKIVSDIGQNFLTSEEKEQRLEFKWVDINELEELFKVKNNHPVEILTKDRDYTFIKKALEKIEGGK